MTTDDMNPRLPDDEQEPPRELFREVCDLVDETVDRVTDDEVDARLHRLLRATGRSSQAEEASFPALDEFRQAVLGPRPIIGSAGWEAESLLVAARREAGEIVAAAHREAETCAADARRAAQAAAEAREQAERIIAKAQQFADAALSRAAEIVSEAREQAERIIADAEEDARQRASDGPADAAGLTLRQRKVLEVIRTAVEHRGYPPSVREIGEAVGLASTSSVAYQLEVLQDKGFLHRDPHRPQTMQVLLPGAVRPGSPAGDDTAASTRAAGSGHPAPANTPVVGRIAAGGPILAEEDVFFPPPTHSAQTARLSGRVDASSVGELRSRLNAAIDSGSGTLRIDVAGLELADHAGLGVLLGGARRARRFGRSILLVNVPAALGTLLEAHRLGGVLRAEEASAIEQSQSISSRVYDQASCLSSSGSGSGGAS